MATIEYLAQSTSYKIKDLAEINPGKHTQAEVARLFGVSRQCVNEIVTGLNLKGKFKRHSWSSLCLGCGKKILSENKSRLCRNCLNESKRARCTCDNCGEVIVRKISEAKRHRHQFCNRYCVGAYAGTHYGYGVRSSRSKL